MAQVSPWSVATGALLGSTTGRGPNVPRRWDELLNFFTASGYPICPGGTQEPLPRPRNNWECRPGWSARDRWSLIPTKWMAPPGWEERIRGALNRLHRSHPAAIRLARGGFGCASHPWCNLWTVAVARPRVLMLSLRGASKPTEHTMVRRPIQVAPKIVEEVTSEEPHPPTPAEEEGVEETQHRRRRFHPGTVALRQIVRLQRGTGPLMQRGPFRRMVNDILRARKADARLQNRAALVLQEAAQGYLVGLFHEANLVALHSNRTTVAARDLRLVRKLHAGGVDKKERPTAAPPATPPPEICLVGPRVVSLGS